MKKFTLRLMILFLISIQSIYSFDIETASKIYDKLFYAVFQKEYIRVYVDDERYKKMISSSKYLIFTDKIDISDIIIITKESELEYTKGKIAFSIEKDFIEKSKDIIGAFYWNKGRPEIIFIKDRLEKNNLHLLESFEKYAK